MSSIMSWTTTLTTSFGDLPLGPIYPLMALIDDNLGLGVFDKQSGFRIIGGGGGTRPMSSALLASVACCPVQPWFSSILALGNWGLPPVELVLTLSKDSSLTVLMELIGSPSRFGKVELSFKFILCFKFSLFCLEWLLEFWLMFPM